MSKRGIRDGFGKAMLELAKKNKNIYALSADLTKSLRLDTFKEKFPKQFIEVGISEQNMVGIGAGFAIRDKIPFICSYAAFNPGRNWEQIRVSICYSQANVKIIGGHGGIVTGADGATHQALEDVALTQVLPNMTVIVPSDYEQARQATHAISEHKGPCYLRLSRMNIPDIYTKSSCKFKIGKARKLKDGEDITIIACGIMVHEALKAHEELEKLGIKAQVLDCPTIKPLDKKAILKAAQKTNRIVVCEEHQIIGGLGSSIAQFLSQEYPVEMGFVGMHDTFGESGKPKELLAKYKMTYHHIVQKVKKIMHD